jgi:hypothetical protein
VVAFVDAVVVTAVVVAVVVVTVVVTGDSDNGVVGAAQPQNSKKDIVSARIRFIYPLPFAISIPCCT